jgi:signal transduction histidine kinase
MTGAEVDAPDIARRLERAEQQLRVLRDVALALESTMSFDEVLTLAVDRTTRLMCAERSTLFLVEADGGLVSRVLEGEGVNEIRLAPGQGIAGWVARHGVPAIVPDVRCDERFDPTWDQKTGFETRSVVCHPITGRHGTPIGVAEVLNRSGGGVFGEGDLESLGLLCGQIALTIENSRMLVDLVAKNRAITSSRQELERRCRELTLLLDLERLAARAEDIDSLASAVLSRSNELIGSRTAVLHLVNETGSVSRAIAVGQSRCRIVRVEPGAGFSGWVAAKGREILVNSPEGDPRFQEVIVRRIGAPLENLAAVPLPFGEDQQNHGSILAANKPGGFVEGDLVMLRLVAVLLAQAVEHIRDRVSRERERRLATVGRLLAGVLHDLKSPMTVVSGYAELLAAKTDDLECEDYLAQINKALDRIAQMAAEIIAFSKGERRVLLHPVSINQFVESFSKQVQPQLDANGVSFSTCLRTAGVVRLDEDKLTRALHNVVNNAIEAMQSGGDLTMEVYRAGADVVFSFTDTGSGIPEEIQGTLFESFVTSGKENGTGLGLAVAREIVEAHNGKISFTTLKGQGTTFLISIPA